MNTMGISTDPAMLDVELPSTLIESPSVSTFMPEEEASVCPLLSSANRTSTPLQFSHPLDNESNESTNLCNEHTKDETGSSTGSSSGIAMEVSETLFGKHSNYQHFQHNNGGIIQDANGNATNGSLKLSENAPFFVSWNWPLIRKFSFYTFMLSLLAMFVLVVAMIIALPKTCNPSTTWYHGGVFYEIFPASFQDSNNDGIGDLRGINSRVDYFASMGFAAVRLNSIFPSPKYPEDFENVASIIDIAHVLGTPADLYELAKSLHAQNISLILDLPVGHIIREHGKSDQHPSTSVTVALNESDSHSAAAKTPTTIQASNGLIRQAIRKWLDLGVDGFYIKGLEQFNNYEDIINNLAEWKRIIGDNRALIVSEDLVVDLPSTQKANALDHIDLVDVYLDISSGTKRLEEIISSKIKDSLSPIETGAWIHWNIGGVDHSRLTGSTQHENITLAATLMQLILPGTPSIFYGDEVALQSIIDSHREHNETSHLHHLSTMPWSNTAPQFISRDPWLPKTAIFNLENAALVSEMIKLRRRSPSIYKNAICKPETKLQNTQIRLSHYDILLVERVYPRRNSFVTVSNLEFRRVSMDMTSLFYSGVKMLNAPEKNEKIYFKNFEIGPFETIVVRLDK